MLEPTLVLSNALDELDTPALAIIGSVAGLLMLALMFNSLIRHKNAVREAFAAVDAQLKQRYDLIPNLIAAVKRYMSHESTVLRELTELRTRGASSDLSPEQSFKLDNDVVRGIGSFMLRAEAYPDLKASENFVQLQRSLNEVEAQIAAARRTYNSAVTGYNNAIETIPTNIMAKLMGYKHKQLFEIPAEQRENVDVAALFGM